MIDAAGRLARARRDAAGHCVAILNPCGRHLDPATRDPIVAPARKRGPGHDGVATGA